VGPVLGTGTSQSCLRLVTYISKLAAGDGVFDGFDPTTCPATAEIPDNLCRWCGAPASGRRPFRAGPTGRSCGCGRPSRPPPASNAMGTPSGAIATAMPSGVYACRPFDVPVATYRGEFTDGGGARPLPSTVAAGFMLPADRDEWMAGVSASPVGRPTSGQP
jgi:hypothetical protein